MDHGNTKIPFSAKFDSTCKDSKNLMFCLLTSFLWGLIAHAYGFLNSNFSHDALNAIYAGAVEDRLKIELGRFIVPVYRFFRGDLSLPWLNGLLALLYIGIALYLITRIFDITSKPLIVLISGIMVTNITVTAITATYIFEIDYNMLAMLLSVMAVYIWKRYCNIRGIIGGALVLIMSMGIYQSYLSLAITLVIIISVIDVLNGKETRGIVKRGLFAIAMIAASGILYYAVSNTACVMIGTELKSRNNVFDFSSVDSIPAFYGKLFIQTYRFFLSFFFSDNLYPQLLIISLVSVMFFIFAFIVLYCFRHDKKISASGKAVFILLCIILPFGMNITYFLARGDEIHDLTTYAIWFVYVFFLVILSLFTESGKYSFKHKNALKIAGCALAVIFLWQNIVISNSAYLKKDLEHDATLSLMTRVVEELEDREDFIPGETEVAFIGISDLTETIEGFEGVGTLAGLTRNDAISYDSSFYYYNAYKAYFKYILNYPMKFCDDDTHKKLKENSHVDEMPSFPAEGCMEVIDGVLVIKIGNRD